MGKSAAELIASIPNAAVPAAGLGLTLDPMGRIPSAAAPYQAYTPTWTSTGTAPAIGNASVTARYVQIGKLVHAWGIITFGTTSTFGTGQWLFAAPVAFSGSPILCGSCYLFDTSAGNAQLAIISTSGASLTPVSMTTWAGTQSTLNNAFPWTWATGDQISWNITYEAAA